MNQPTASTLANLEEIREFEKTPALERYPWRNTYELLQHGCNQYTDSTALTFLADAKPGGATTTVTYLHLSVRITQTANLLNSLGVGCTDAVSILLPSLPETHYALWGASAAGIASPINPFLEPGQISEIMNVTKSKVLITLAPGNDFGLWEKVCTVVQNTPTLKAIVLINQPFSAETSLPVSPREEIRLVVYNDLIEHQDKSELTSGRVFEADDISMYLHTGGTTGSPKVAQLSHGGQAFMSQLYTALTNRRGRFTALCGLPLFHVFGLMATSISAFTAGRHMVQMTPLGFRNPEVIKNFWFIVARFRPRVVACVPTILSALLDVPVGNNDISSLEEIPCGAAPLPIQLKENFAQRFSVTVINGYGMTESSLALSRAAPDFPPPPGSVGLRLPYMKTITAIVDGDQLVRKCKTHETGVVLTQGPNLFSGYLDPKDNEGAWVDQCWFNTGDLAYQDEQGYFFLTGRIKDLIIRGGHNIDPAFIEEPLGSHPAVSQAVAVGQPDPYAGEVPVAYVTLKTGMDVDVNELMEHCRNTIAERAAVPKRIEVIEHLPLTAVAKIYRPALRQRATEFALRSTLNEAGVEASVITRYDRKIGLVAEVTLLQADQLQQAETLLQGFPLGIEFNTQAFG